ncbi:hypothetical protein AC1031_016178 [Aphanomyces cochlioides]|nr:hypothetical protein AC1031_016178 [Aphanomyces cochlioides]
MALYAGVEKKPFRFQHCYRVLNGHPKWGAWRASLTSKTGGEKRKQPTLSSDIGLDGMFEESEPNKKKVQPTNNDQNIHGYGQKKAKEDRLKNSLFARKVEAAEQIAKNGEARAQTLRDQLQIQRDNFELATFTTKVDDSDSELAYYLEMKRKSILKRLEAEENEPNEEE